VKSLPPALAASLASGVTTLCACWRLERADGVILGFTDHDRDLAFGSVTYRAETGMSATAWAERSGLAVDTIEALGALSSGALTEDDLARGLWDNAAVEVWRVDWSAVENRVLLFAGSIGEVARGPLAFQAELRSLAHALNQPRGRTYSNACDADLGDARCGVNLASPLYSAAATVSEVVSRAAFKTTGIGGFEASWCKGGRVSWTGGANAGAAMEVKRHTLAGGVATIELSAEMPFDIDVGDGFAITAGCDKARETCLSKFSNLVNHRGFPFMPGNDWVAAYPNKADGNDGGSLV
jgi:uncharacterized phage protein (TIGR02218 family)